MENVWILGGYQTDFARNLTREELDFRRSSNPNAQTRNWTVPDLATDDIANPVVDGRIRRFNCSQMTDSGAGVILVTEGFLREHPPSVSS